MEKDDQCSTHSFWADDETEEQAIWVKLLDLLRDLGDCTIFHYGAYEKTYIKRMLRKYPSTDTPFPGTWDSALFNVLGAIRTNVYFPTYSNGLKDIALYLGVTLDGQGHFWHRMHCSQASMGGVQRSGDQGRDPAYNRQDCLAVQRVAVFLSSLSSEGGSGSQVELASEVVVESHKKFGKVAFALPEMGFINKCARFNYQRDKVLVRTDPAVRSSARRKQARTRAILKPNVEIRCEPQALCPFCELGSSHHLWQSRLLETRV